MKALNIYVNEKLVLNKDTFRKAKYKYFPEKKRELESIITDLLDKHAGQEVIDLNDIDISNINDISFLFYKRNDIHNIDVSKWDVSKVTNMNSIFAWCTNLESVGDLSSWNVSKVRYMTGMFYNCKNLKSPGDLSEWNTKNLNNTDYMFYKCDKLKDVGDFSNWIMSKIDDISYMFYGCENLKSIGDISGWNLRSIKSMIRTFCNCSNLKSVGNLNNWNISNMYGEDMRDTFEGSGITDIPAWYKG